MYGVLLVKYIYMFAGYTIHKHCAIDTKLCLTRNSPQLRASFPLCFIRL